MKIGLWNIDHPECHPESIEKNARFSRISNFLTEYACDVYIVGEANSAMKLEGYQSYFSDESPFRNSSRCYDVPNQYHQAAIYGRHPLSKVDIDEPVNGVLCKSNMNRVPIFVYGNVVTIKDQWSKTSDKKYSDRLAEQIKIFDQLSGKRFLIAGDFNLRLGWPQKKKSHETLKELVDQRGWIWPTENQTKTVQHVIHSPDLIADLAIDHTVKHTKGKQDQLSDHPFVTIELREAA